MSAALRTRFAPSPTGYLHLGHAYSALLASDFARANGGTFLLRFEDIDQTRCREEYYRAVETDLAWLGIEWSRPALRQSSRMPHYEDALNTLRELGLLYPCFCTRKQVARDLAAPHQHDQNTYAGTCRKLSQRDTQALLDAGQDHAWRFDSSRAQEHTGPLHFVDSLRGETEVNLAPLGDLILGRKDILCSYHLAVVVDDAAQGITEVVRGHDLLASTHLHRTLQALLKLPSPRYHHHRLITDATGKRLAKRDEARSLRSLRAKGAGPAEVREMIAPFEQLLGR